MNSEKHENDEEAFKASLVNYKYFYVWKTTRINPTMHFSQDYGQQ